MRSVSCLSSRPSAYLSLLLQILPHILSRLLSYNYDVEAKHFLCDKRHFTACKDAYQMERDKNKPFFLISSLPYEEFIRLLSYNYDIEVEHLLTLVAISSILTQHALLTHVFMRETLKVE